MIRALSLDHPADFVFDVEQLKSDYQRVKDVYPDKVSFMLTFVTPESSEVMDNIHDRTYLSRLYAPEIFKMPFKDLYWYNHERLSMDNFHVMMRGTYTHKVLLTIDAKLRTEGQRISYAEYHELPSTKCYPMHSDIGTHRFHLPIVTNEFAFLTVEQHAGRRDYEMVNMPECGKVYTLPTDTHHTAVNAGYDTRIHLMYDTIAL